MRRPRSVTRLSASSAPSIRSRALAFSQFAAGGGVSEPAARGIGQRQRRDDRRARRRERTGRALEHEPDEAGGDGEDDGEQKCKPHGNRMLHGKFLLTRELDKYFRGGQAKSLVRTVKT